MPPLLHNHTMVRRWLEILRGKLLVNMIILRGLATLALSKNSAFIHYCRLRNFEKVEKWPILQMFARIYRVFTGKLKCGDCMYTCNHCNFWSRSKKKCGLFIYTYSLLRFFKFSYNFCGDFRGTCNPRDNYMHFRGYPVQHGVSSHFLWGSNL